MTTKLFNASALLKQNPSDPSSSLLEYTSLAAYFHDHLGQVRQSQSFEATDPAEFYVVNLLESVAFADQFHGLDDDGKRRSDALAEILGRAVFASPAARVAHYRRLGDLALVIAGIFADSLRRCSVGVTYYIDMGQGAYSTLADAMRGKEKAAFREIYAELADGFAGWVEVLRELGERMGLSRRLDALSTREIYERWMGLQDPQSRKLASALFARGLMPAR